MILVVWNWMEIFLKKNLWNDELENKYVWCYTAVYHWEQKKKTASGIVYR